MCVSGFPGGASGKKKKALPIQKTEEMKVRSLEEGMATNSSILAWKIPWTEEPGGLQSIGSQRVGTEATYHTHTQYMIHMNAE